MRPAICALLALVVFASCGRSITETETCTSSIVFRDEPFYVARAETEHDFRGVLEFRDNGSVPPTRRDYHYFLNGTPVYSGGFATEPTFKNAAGDRVTIRGKVVNFTEGPEIWSASLTSCR